MFPCRSNSRFLPERFAELIEKHGQYFGVTTFYCHQMFPVQIADREGFILGKSKVRMECGGRDFQDSDIRKVSAYMMGMEKFDGAVFSEAIDHITVLEDGSLEFYFNDGREERWKR